MLAEIRGAGHQRPAGAARARRSIRLPVYAAQCLLEQVTARTAVEYFTGRQRPLLEAEQLDTGSASACTRSSPPPSLDATSIGEAS